VTLRERVYEALEGPAHDKGEGRAWNLFMFSLIALNAVAVILGTVSAVEQRFAVELESFEAFSVAVFACEYVLRLWAVALSPKYGSKRWGRLRFAFTPLALIDLAAILPILLSMSADLRILRIVRLTRLARLMKIARYSRATALLGRVIARTKEALIVAAVSVLGLIVIAASLMYYAEREAQPKAFSSIPRAMWWAVVTITTVGYGDVYPITDVGKFIGGLIAIAGIASFAFPTAILGAGFLAEMEHTHPKRCPSCGADLPEGSHG
jgi:voltage-gated potassium channel